MSSTAAVARVAALLVLSSIPTSAQSPPAVHRLAATPSTVAYGYYWAQAKPALRIASGDIVEVETLLTNVPDRLIAAGVPADQVEESLKAVVTQVTDKGPGGHILTGPIYVEGAEPGDVLEVRILEVRPALGYGYNGCSGFMRDACGPQGGPSRTRIIPLDTVKMTADLGNGIIVPLHPFFGSMGVAPPPDSGRVSSNPPGIHAGNLDNKELVAGTVLFIPVHVAGALLEVGDGHVAQGDGEVDQTAIETSLRGRLQLLVRKGKTLAWPRAETPTHVITMGTDTSLTVATRIALKEMINYLMEARALPSVEAYRLASIAGDLHITQLVDGRVGVHMMIPKGLIGTGAMSPEVPPPGPASSQVEVATSRGKVVVAVDRALAPHGADRFYELIRSGYFDDSRFFRVRDKDIAQFGIPGTADPQISRTPVVPPIPQRALGDFFGAGGGFGWRFRAIMDDSVRTPNARGTLAFAMTGPNTRTTQLFVSLKDHPELDSQGFAPIGRVVAGLEEVDRLYSGYGDNSGGGMRGRKQDSLFSGGNRYLDTSFPKLAKLIRARIVGEPR